jgi:hypothetical protein
VSDNEPISKQPSQRRSTAWRRRPTWVVAALILSVPIHAAIAAEVIPGGIQLEPEASVDAVPRDVVDTGVESTTSAAGEPAKTREFVVAPLPSYSSLLGWTLAVPAMFIYKPAIAGEEGSPWISGAAAFYSANESVGGGLYHRMSLDDDRWRLTGAAFLADLRYDYFGIGNPGDFSIPLKQKVSVVLAQALYEVADDLYVGIRAAVSTTDVGFDIPVDQLPPIIEPGDLARDFKLVSLAPTIQYDTRDSLFYPRDGWLVEGRAAFGIEGIGSDLGYEKFTIAANRYASIGPSTVLALRAASEYAGGDAPFFLYPAFGSQSDLRGYESGTYRDRFLLAVQAELRHRFTDRIGAVAFAGIGTVASDFADWGPSLPSAGLGLRYVLAPKYGMSLRVDVAVGRDDTQFYVSIGEAF